MRGIGSLHPTEGITITPEVVAVLVPSSAGVTIAQDYPAGSASASSRPHIMLLSGQVGFFFQDGTTGASVPATNGTTPGSTLNSVYIEKTAMYQIPGGSTGYSVAFPTTGFVTVEFFRRATST